MLLWFMQNLTASIYFDKKISPLLLAIEKKESPLFLTCSIFILKDIEILYYFESTYSTGLVSILCKNN